MKKTRRLHMTNDASGRRVVAIQGCFQRIT